MLNPRAGQKAIRRNPPFMFFRALAVQKPALPQLIREQIRLLFSGVAPPLIVLLDT